MNSKLFIAVVCIVISIKLTLGQHSRGETLNKPLQGYYGQSHRHNPNQHYQIQTQQQTLVYNSPPQPEFYPPPVDPFGNPLPNLPQTHVPSIPVHDTRYSNMYTQTSQQSYPQSNPTYSRYPQPAVNTFQQNNPSIQSYNPQTQSQPSFDSRIDGEQVTSDDFSTRPPPSRGTKRPPTTKKPPPQILNSRFDDRNNEKFKKSLSYDSELSDSIEKFSLRLLVEICSDQTENFMISPYSIYHLLVLLGEGSAGNTYKQISDTLEFRSLTRTRDFQQYLSEVLKRSTSDVVLKKFTMLVTDKNRPYSTDFENAIETTYDAIVEPVNFFDVDKTTQELNDKIARATEGQITDTVERDDLIRAQLILISGLFFRGSWMNVFNTTFTRREPFFDTNGNQIGNVNMMFQRGPLAYSAIANISCHVLELPYAEAPITSRGEIFGSGLSMVIVLPRKGLSLADAMANVYSFTMNKIYKELYNSKLEYEDEEVEVHLPRFQITASYDVKDFLQRLGINDAFDQSRADLSKINSNYFVSSMIHKTKISVDEKGTTAAAVTTSIFANKATPPKFHANKPFLFFIVDKTTNLILFSGQYTVPELY